MFVVYTLILNMMCCTMLSVGGARNRKIKDSVGPEVSRSGRVTSETGSYSATRYHINTST